MERMESLKRERVGLLRPQRIPHQRLPRHDTPRNAPRPLRTPHGILPRRSPLPPLPLPPTTTTVAIAVVPGLEPDTVARDWSVGRRLSRPRRESGEGGGRRAGADLE